MGHGLSGTALDLSKSFQMNRHILVPRRSGKRIAVSGVGEFVHGDTSASQRAIGTGVIGGMVAGTILAVFFVPIFFVVVRSIFKGSERQHQFDVEHGHQIGAQSHE